MNVFSIVLAGGEGKRLAPLTLDRAKPAVPFGGSYRLIDFALSNLVNAGFLQIAVLTQYKSHSLDRHIATTWRLSPLLGNYVTPVPAQMRRGPQWFQGSADAIYQNLNLIHDENPDIVCVFGADHIYRMDPRQMVEHHREVGAGVTVAAIPVPKADARDFGVIEVDGAGRILAFHEKSLDPPTMPGDDTRCLASMGNYVFETQTLIDIVTPDQTRPLTDMGGDVIPALTRQAGTCLGLTETGRRIGLSHVGRLGRGYRRLHHRLPCIVTLWPVSPECGRMHILRDFMARVISPQNRRE